MKKETIARSGAFSTWRLPQSRGVRVAIAAVTGAALLMAPAVSVRAAIPPSSYVIKKMVSKRTGIRMLRIRSSVSVLDSGFAGDSSDSFRFRSVSFVDFDARKVRTRVMDDQGQILLEGERSWGDSSATPKLPGGFAANASSPAVLGVLFESNPDLLQKQLIDSGIPVLGEAELKDAATEADRRDRERMGFGRLGDAIAWVIGSDRGASLAREARIAAAETAAKAGGEPVSSDVKAELKPSLSQLWIQRDSLTPLRLLLRNRPEQKQGWDIHMESPKPLRDGNFPRLISVLDLEKMSEDPFDIAPRAIDGKRKGDAASVAAAQAKQGKARVILEEIVELTVNPDMAGEVPLQKSEWSDAGDDLDSKSKRSIELYFRTLR